MQRTEQLCDLKTLNRIESSKMTEMSNYPNLRLPITDANDYASYFLAISPFCLSFFVHLFTKEKCANIRLSSARRDSHSHVAPREAPVDVRDTYEMRLSSYIGSRIPDDGGQSLLIAGYSYDPDCMYVNGTGRDYYEFYIQLNRCGTLGENTHHQDSRKNPTVCKTNERG